ncbi:dihydrofolate reductase family protein [Patescibacteria group bacterium]
MFPKVILHNSTTLDGAYKDFDVNMGLHYSIAEKFKPDVHFIGSDTLAVGAKEYGGKISEETVDDFLKPEKSESLPLWVIPDTTGKCKGILHMFRQFEFCRDVVILTSRATPKKYINYLDDREYDNHQVGSKKVNLTHALELLNEEYGTETVLLDTGPTLGNLFLQQKLVSQVSLLVHPVISNQQGEKLLAPEKQVNLTISKIEKLKKKYIWLLYDVK